MMADLDFESETDLQTAAPDTKIRMIDFNGDGIPETLAEGMVNRGPTGNCPFWTFRRGKSNYELVLAGHAQTFTIQEAVTNGFYDIVLSRHSSSSSGDLTDYRYREGACQEVGCYDNDWTVLEREMVRELKESRLTPVQRTEKSEAPMGPSYRRVPDVLIQTVLAETPRPPTVQMKGLGV